MAAKNPLCYPPSEFRRFGNGLNSCGRFNFLTIRDAGFLASDLSRRQGFTLIPHEARNINDLNTAFDLIPRDSADALMVFGDGLTYARRRENIAFAARMRLPEFYTWREMVTDGGLMSYGYNLADAYRRSAKYVDRILKGTKPGDLPIELPVKLELVINLKTAKSLGIVMPSQLLAHFQPCLGSD